MGAAGEEPAVPEAATAATAAEAAVVAEAAGNAAAERTMCCCSQGCPEPQGGAAQEEGRPKPCEAQGAHCGPRFSP